MKRLLWVFLIFPVILFAGCNDKKATETLARIEVDPLFVSHEFYVNESLVAEDFSLKLVYSTGREEIKTLADATIENFNTQQAGEVEVVITYLGVSQRVTISVLPPEVVNIRYPGEPLVFYVGEGLDLSGKVVLVLFKGSGEVSMNLCDLLLVSCAEEVARFEFEGHFVNIDYKAEYRQIVLGQEYEVKMPFMEGDFVGVVSESGSGFSLAIFNAATNEMVYPFSLKDLGDGHFETHYMSNSERLAYDVFLANGVIQFVLKD